MSNTLKTLLKLSAAAMTFSFVVGCATQASNDLQAQIDEVRETALNANSTAEEALSTANEAEQTAQEAMGMAKSAQYTANQNSEKIDRMFKKSMYK